MGWYTLFGEFLKTPMDIRCMFYREGLLVFGVAVTGFNGCGV